MSIIPERALEECIAIIGRTGAGKSYTARGLVESILDRNERLCVIDPTGVWWGLRLRRNGKTKGYKVAVFGGDYADVQIGDASGSPLAELIAERNLPCVIDLSGFTIGGRTRFLTAFLETLYAKNRRTPLTMVIDEADVVAPQRVQPEQTIMFSRLEQIVRRGRVRGFRPWLITQRPAELHKSVLSQAGTLIALKLTAPQDRKAVEGWVMGHADATKGREVLASLAGLARGEGWVWCPGADLVERVKFPQIGTYDSMRTPAVGERRPQPASLSDIDLSAIRDSLKAVEAETAANDPKRLRARIAELERHVKNVDLKVNAKPQVAPPPDSGALDAAHRAGFEAAWRQFQKSDAGAVRSLRAALEAATKAAEQLAAPKDAPTAPARMGGRPTGSAKPPPTVAGENATIPSYRPFARGRAPHAASSLTNNDLGPALPVGERAILTAAAQWDGTGVERDQLSVLTGYKRSSRDAYIARLLARGYIEVSGQTITATAAGMAALGPNFEPLPVGRDLQTYWLGQLPEGERRILDLLIAAYPQVVARADLDGATGYKRSSRDAYLSRMRARRVIEIERGGVRASPTLF